MMENDLFHQLGFVIVQYYACFNGHGPDDIHKKCMIRMCLKDSN